MKRRKKHTTSGKDRTLPRRGRPPKVDRENILDRDRQWVARRFQQHQGSLREPVDSSFKPYYERFLQGDLRAIVEYSDNKWPQLGASFYELIGRLLFLSHYDAVKKVLAEVSHAGLPDKRETYKHWYKKLLPLCQAARKFISETLTSHPGARTQQLWCDYRSRHGQQVVQEAESHTRESVRSHLASLGCSGKDLQSLTEGNFTLEGVQELGTFGLVPQDIFFDLLHREGLGTQRFSWTPAFLARRYACKIARVSESWASRKDVRK